MTHPERIERVDQIVDYMRSASYPEHGDLLKDAQWLENTADEMETKLLELRNRCLASEIYDLCGRYDRARRAIRTEADEALRLLRRARKEAQDRPWWKTGSEEKRLLRQRLWTLLHHGNALYRTQQVDEMRSVLKLFRECQDILDACLPIEHEEEHKEPSYGLRSRIAYSEGVVYLRLEDFNTARQRFSLAMDFQQQRFDAKIAKFQTGDGGRDSTDADRERAYGRYTAAKIFGLGLGWCSLRSGELHRARAAIACARTIFEFGGDRLHKAFMELLYATTLRMQNQKGDHRELDKAVALLEKVTVEDGPFAHHNHYRARALYELAAARLDKNVIDSRVDDLLKDVAKLVKENDALAANARLLACRKERLTKSIDSALETARKVSHDFDKNEKVLVRALVAQAECKIDLRLFPEADEDLEEAMSLAHANPLLMGICHLHRAQCLIEMDRSAEARDQLDRWRTLRPRIEDAYAIQLSNEVEARILGGKGLWLSRREALSLKMKDIDGIVIRQIVDAYRSEYGADWIGQAAKGLGRKKSAIHEWLSKYGISATRPGTPEG